LLLLLTYVWYGDVKINTSYKLKLSLLHMSTYDVENNPLYRNSVIK
jgi:hypothetical protein